MMKDWKNFLDTRFCKGIAHRGLHDETRTENGLEAFRNAIAHDKAFEFDIHLTKDGQLVVVHDSDLKRVTGKEGTVEEKTLAELKRDYRLLDGEEIPTLEEVLSLNDGRVPMVIELKACGGNRAIKALSHAARAALQGRVDPRKAIIISFDPRALLFFGSKSGFHLSLLVCLERKWTLGLRNFFDSLDLDQRLLLDKKVFAYRKKGRLVNTWTIRSLEALRSVSPYADLITYENFVYPE